MKMRYFIIPMVFAAVAVGCVSSLEREGQRLFASCDHHGVDNKATLKSGEFVCKGARINPFHGSKPSANNRSCGDCHQPGTNFALPPSRVKLLPANHPVFFTGLDENIDKLKSDALIRIKGPGIDEFRQTPKLIHLRDLCDKKGNCDGLGLAGDAPDNLDVFTVLAIQAHMSASTARVPGEDFRVPTMQESKAITAYMLSRLVADQDERLRK